MTSRVLTVDEAYSRISSVFRTQDVQWPSMGTGLSWASLCEPCRLLRSVLAFMIADMSSL